MAEREWLWLGASYLCLLLATADDAERFQRQWYHLPGQIRALVMLVVLCILLSTLSPPQSAQRCQVKTQHAGTGDWSWEGQDFSYY